MNDNMMWALVKEKPEKGLWMKRVPIPEVGPTDVKIKIHKNAICGTDVHIYEWNEWAQNTISVGMTAGHEYNEVRVTGISKMHDALRVIGKDGLNEIPIKLIKSITDAGKTKFPGVTIS